MKNARYSVVYLRYLPAENISFVFDHIRSGRGGSVNSFEPLLSRPLQQHSSKKVPNVGNTTSNLDLFEGWFEPDSRP